MSLMGRMEKASKSEFQESGAASFSQALRERREAADAVAERDLKVVTEYVNNLKNELGEFARSSIVYKPSKLFEEPYFFPLQGMTDTEKFNATFRGSLLFATSVFLYYVAKQAYLTGTLDRTSRRLGLAIVATPVVIVAALRLYYSEKERKVHRAMAAIPARRREIVKEVVSKEMGLGAFAKGTNSFKTSIFHSNEVQREPLRLDGSAFFNKFSPSDL